LGVEGSRVRKKEGSEVMVMMMAMGEMAEWIE